MTLFSLSSVFFFLQGWYSFVAKAIFHLDGTVLAPSQKLWHLFFLFPSILATRCHFFQAITQLTHTSLFYANNLCHFIEWLMFCFVLRRFFLDKYLCHIAVASEEFSGGSKSITIIDLREVEQIVICCTANIWLSIMRFCFHIRIDAKMFAWSNENQFWNHWHRLTLGAVPEMFINY